MLYRIHERGGSKFTVQQYDQQTYHDWTDMVDELLDYNTAYICMNNLARVISQVKSQPVVAIARISTRVFVDGKEIETV